MERMTAKRIDSLRKPGRYRADQTLYFVVEPGGRSQHWVQRLVVAGRRRDIGLGSYPLTNLSEARERAWENRRLARQGGDPLPRVSRVPTFRQAGERVEAACRWGDRTRENRRAALDRYCGSILDKRLDQIRRADVIAIVAPVMSEKRSTGSKLHGWIRGALAWAVAHEHLEHNVADGIGAALPSAPRVEEHHSAIPYEQVPQALRAISSCRAGDATKACLRFVVLTAVRSGEARLATWDEIDHDAREWRIPASRTKTGAEHRVPLSGAAVAILEAARAHRGRSGLVFPGVQGRHIDPTTLVKALRAAGYAATVHGFRSSFRTWAAERTHVTRDIAEMALAHRVGSDVERSYARSDLFEKRRALMDAWAAFVTGDTGKVLHIAASS